MDVSIHFTNVRVNFMFVSQNEHYAGHPISKYSFPFTNTRIHVYFDKHNRMSFVKHICLCPGAWL